MVNKFVDTNIFVEVFVRFGKKSDRCKVLLKEAKNLQTSSLVFSEIEWVLRSVYELDKGVVVKCLKTVISSNIEIDNKMILIKAIEFYESHPVDWTDCLNMFLMSDDDVREVYSYDKGLSKFDWIQRLEP
ncbi:PIN domain-containing protein [Candidatus Gottesmanbacteria bacterium]|nr:PIN domain-containing protein [Candidatus Gottesmanbacteria bacterium]